MSTNPNSDDFPPLSPGIFGPPPLTIDRIQLNGVIEVIESGGMNTVSKRAERGFEFSSYVNKEPVEAEVETFIEIGKYDQITSLRESEEPVIASLGDLVLTNAVIDDVEIIQQAEITSHHRANIQLREVKTPGAEQVTIVQTGAGITASSIQNDPDFVTTEKAQEEVQALEDFVRETVNNIDADDTFTAVIEGVNERFDIEE